MTSSTISDLAAKQLSDYDSRRPGRIFEKGADFLTVEQAYELQTAVAKLRRERGETVAGYKIGCLSRPVREQLGLDRAVFGHVFAGEVHRDGSTLELRRFDGLANEGEFALRLAKDLTDIRPAIARPREFIAAVFPVIELHNYVFRAPQPAAQELIANNALHAGIVAPKTEPELLDPEKLLDETITVRRNDEVLGTAEASAVPGGPLGSLRELFERLESFGIELKAGQIVLTGSPLPLYGVNAGDRIEVTSARLGSVRAEVSS